MPMMSKGSLFLKNRTSIQQGVGGFKPRVVQGHFLERACRYYQFFTIMHFRSTSYSGRVAQEAAYSGWIYGHSTEIEPASGYTITDSILTAPIHDWER